MLPGFLLASSVLLNTSGFIRGVKVLLFHLQFYSVSQEMKGK